MTAARRPPSEPDTLDLILDLERARGELAEFAEPVPLPGEAGPAAQSLADPLRCPDYEAITALGFKLKRPSSSLIALTGENDPFFAKRPARLAKALWFAQVWPTLDPPDGLHLRRLHYKYASLPQDSRPPKLDGAAYENTFDDWKAFSGASTDARALTFVDAALFTDRRAGEPLFVASDSDSGSDASVTISHPGQFRRLALWAASITRRWNTPSRRWPRRSRSRLRPYPRAMHSKSGSKNRRRTTSSCRWRERDVTLVIGLGDFSWTHCVWHVDRVLRHRKPTRILYISDFDPKGIDMPLGVARKIEFLLRRDGHDLDIRLDPLVLTREQVEQYRLAAMPIKDFDKGKRGFEERHGEGAVELDALEALYPGELARIVNETIDIYPRRDPASHRRERARPGAGGRRGRRAQASRHRFLRA